MQTAADREQLERKFRTALAQLQAENASLRKQSKEARESAERRAAETYAARAMAAAPAGRARMI